MLPDLIALTTAIVIVVRVELCLDCTVVDAIHQSGRPTWTGVVPQQHHIYRCVVPARHLTHVVTRHGDGGAPGEWCVKEVRCGGK